MQGMPYGGYGRGYMMPQYPGSYPYGNPYAQYNPYYGQFDQLPPGMDQNFHMQPPGHYAPNIHGGYDLHAPQPGALDESFPLGNETTPALGSAPETSDLHSSPPESVSTAENQPPPKVQERQETLPAPANTTDSKPAPPATSTPESATNVPTQQPAPPQAVSTPISSNVPSQPILTSVSTSDTQNPTASATRPEPKEFASNQQQRKPHSNAPQKKFVPSANRGAPPTSQPSHQEYKPRDTRPPQPSNDTRQDKSSSSSRGRGSGIRGKGNYNRSRNRRVTGQFTGPESPQAVFDEDFDFESSLAKFDKEKFTAQLGEPTSEEALPVPIAPAYEKSMFFDNISCESNEREERDHRSLQHQRKLDSETFGNLALDDNKNRRGGRGRRPYSNRNNTRPRGTANQSTPNNSRGVSSFYSPFFFSFRLIK
jgi:hypothetical protein